MLKKIETQEIMTSFEACVKYTGQYFMMVITTIVDQGDNDLGYVIYAAEDERDLPGLHMLRDEYKDQRIAYMIGWAAEPFPQFDRIVHYG